MILSSDLSTFIGPSVPGVPSFLDSVPQNSSVSGMVHHFVIHNLAGVCPLDSLHGNAIGSGHQNSSLPHLSSSCGRR